MDAQERGAKRGFEYARSQRIEKMTFTEYCAVGKMVAEQTYQQEKARFGFLYGWRQAGEVNRTIFKLENDDIHSGERKIQVIRSIVQGASAKAEALLPWREDDQELHMLLVRVYTALDQTQHDLDRALKRL